MSDEMPSWRALASAASRSIKSYVSQRDFKRAFPVTRDVRADGDRFSRVQSWGQWAGQKLRRGSQNDGSAIERVSLFPGWATREYHHVQDNTAKDGTPFDVEVFVSGFASRSSGLGFGSRSGRAFLRIAKGYAALPKLAPVGVPVIRNATDSRAVEDSNLYFPDEMDEGAIAEQLDNEVRDLDPLEEDGASSTAAGLAEPMSFSYTGGSRNHPLNSPASPNSIPRPKTPARFLTADLQRWHANLEARLYPFWSSALSARTIRVSLYTMDPTVFESDNQAACSNAAEDGIERRPIAIRDVLTAPDGFFQIKFNIPWDTMCTHPGALEIAFGDAALEYNLFILAELFPPISSTPSAHTTVQPPRYFPYPSATTSLSVPLTYSSVRVLSDIDDTVKLSNMLCGARTVFRNVFVKDLRDSVVPGMGDWYMRLWNRGVRFHYVSNGPFELLPVLNDFFQLSHLPQGSIKLRSYAGRSLFSGLLSAPSVRKRAGVIDILDSFATSRFMLVGDSGEQDLELYANIAKERPDQILAIFIRDANPSQDSEVAEGGLKPLDDPTGVGIWRRDSDSDSRSFSSPARRPLSKYRVRSPVRSLSEMPVRFSVHKPMRTYSADVLAPLNKTASGYFSPSLQCASPVSEEPRPLESPSVTPPISRRGSPNYESQSSRGQILMSDSEKRRYDLQIRVYRARLEVPRHIPLRVFRQPEECVEAAAMLDRLQL
ncbi:hypothetical protein BKA93DRAFT_95384 [Sparassis latifolia]